MRIEGQRQRGRLACDGVRGVIERDADAHGRTVVEGAHLQFVLHAAGALHRDHGFVAVIDGHRVIAPGRVLLIDGAVAGRAELDGLAEIAAVHRQAQRGGGEDGLTLALDRPGQLTRGIGPDFNLDLPVRTGDGNRCGINCSFRGYSQKNCETHPDN